MEQTSYLTPELKRKINEQRSVILMAMAITSVTTEEYQEFREMSADCQRASGRTLSEDDADVQAKVAEYNAEKERTVRPRTR